MRTVSLTVLSCLVPMTTLANSDITQSTETYSFQHTIAIMDSLLNENMEFEANDRGFISSATNDAGERLSFEYDIFGSLSSVEDGRGVKTFYEFDDLGKLTKEISAERGTTKIEYDNYGLIKKTCTRKWYYHPYSSR